MHKAVIQIDLKQQLSDLWRSIIIKCQQNIYINTMGITNYMVLITNHNIICIKVTLTVDLKITCWLKWLNVILCITLVARTCMAQNCKTECIQTASLSVWKWNERHNYGLGIGQPRNNKTTHMHVGIRPTYSNSALTVNQLNRTYLVKIMYCTLSLIHIWRCRRSYACRSRWSPSH